MAETFKSLNYYDCNICVKSKLTKCSISPKFKIIEYEYMMYLVKRINIPFWRNTQCFIIIVVHIMYQCSSKSKLLLGNVINWDYMNICLLNYSFWDKLGKIHNNISLKRTFEFDIKWLPRLLAFVKYVWMQMKLWTCNKICLTQICGTKI